jgi:hypothetical protein
MVEQITKFPIPCIYDYLNGSSPVCILNYLEDSNKIYNRVVNHQQQRKPSA